MMRFYEYLNEDVHTDYLETASCIGSVISNSVINKINKFLDSAEGRDDIVNDINSILDKNYDWNTRGKKEVKKGLKNNTKFLEILSLIKGMNNFVNDMVTFNNPQFIHDKIDDYYNVEKEVFGEMSGTKANTADCVIMNTSPKKLFDSMRNSSHTIDETNGSVKFDDGTIYYQVSLKKSKEGAQLGKVTKKLKSMGFDVSPTDGLNESKVLDWLKKVSKNVWNKTSKMVQNILGPLVKRIKKKFNEGITKKDISEVSNIVLNEAKMTSSTENLVSSILSDPYTLLTKINNNINELYSKKGQDVYLNIDKLNDVKNTKDTGTAFKLVSNYKTVKLLNDILDDVEGIGNSIKSLLSDMLFGGTKLPLWKVYGDFGSGISYEYLGTVERYVSQEMPTGIETFGVKISPTKNSYYTITIMMLEKVDSKGKHYVQFRTGTNSSSKFTFIVEGTSEKVISHDKKLESILK